MFGANFAAGGESAAALPPRHAPSALTVAARLGIFALAAVLGVLLVSTVFVGLASLPSGGPGSALAIGGALAILLSGVLLDPVARRRHLSLALYVLGLFAAVLATLLVGGLLALAFTTLDAPLGIVFIITLAGAVGVVSAYLLSGLRVVPPPYQRYVNLGCGAASWAGAAALTLTIPDQAFATIALLGLPCAMVGGLLGGALRMALRDFTSRNRRAATPDTQGERLAIEGQAQSGTERHTATTEDSTIRPVITDGIFWRLLAAFLIGVFAVPFGPGETVTLYISLLILGLFAGIATLLEVSVRGAHPGLLLLLYCIAIIPLGFGYVLVQATGNLLFFAHTGGAAQIPFASFVGICALLCALSVGSGTGGEGTMRRTWGRRLLFWLVVGLLCWVGIATILLWRGMFSAYYGSETPGQFSFAAALPLVWISLPVAPLGALVGGMLRSILAR
jgi:hypothetical protein